MGRQRAGRFPGLPSLAGQRIMGCQERLSCRTGSRGADGKTWIRQVGLSWRQVAYVGARGHRTGGRLEASPLQSAEDVRLRRPSVLAVLDSSV